MLPSDGHVILRILSRELFKFDDNHLITIFADLDKKLNRIIECEKDFNKKYLLRVAINEIDKSHIKFEDPDYLRFKIEIGLTSIDDTNVILTFNDYINEAVFFELIRDGMLEGLFNFEYLRGVISFFNKEYSIGSLSRKYIDEIKEKLLTDIEKLELELI